MNLDAIDPALRRVALLHPQYDYADPAAVRRQMRRRIDQSAAAGLWSATDDRVTWRDDTLSRAGRRVPVRIYEPAAGASCGVVLYLHGGAFVVGDLDLEHPRCLELCREVGATVVAADYRLAPEHPYPAAFEDVTLVLDAVLDGGLGRPVGAADLALVGCSAGGALALGACLLRRDEGLPPPAFQLLIYPVVDDGLATPAMRQFPDTPVWDARNSEHMWRHYLAALPGGAPPHYAVPGRAESVAGLPPTYILTAELDPLRDEAIGLASRLLAAGVPTELHNYPGTFHGFDTLAEAPVSLRARQDACRALRQALGAGAADGRRPGTSERGGAE